MHPQQLPTAKIKLHPAKLSKRLDIVLTTNMDLGWRRIVLELVVSVADHYHQQQNQHNQQQNHQRENQRQSVKIYSVKIGRRLDIVLTTLNLGWRLIVPELVDSVMDQPAKIIPAKIGRDIVLVKNIVIGWRLIVLELAFFVRDYAPSDCLVREVPISLKSNNWSMFALYVF